MKAFAALAGSGLVLIATIIGASAQAGARPGDPLPGISPREFEEFSLGLEDFREIEEAAEGLGPLFNGTGCASCHNVPVIGGGSPMTEISPVILPTTQRSGVTSPPTTAEPSPKAPSMVITERSPVVGLRVNITPAARASTMDCTTTAMATSRSAMPRCRR